MPRAAAPSLSLLLALAACSAGSQQAKHAAAPPAREPLTGEIVVAAEHQGRRALFLLPASGGPARLHAADPARDLFPSPDGTLAIAVVDEGDGALHREQLLRVGAGGSLAPLGPEASRVRHPQLAAGGGFVVVESDHQSFRDLYRIDLAAGAGNATVRLTDDEAGNFQPSLSPDGARVVFASSRDGDSELYVQALAGGEPQRLTAFHQDDWAPLWSPDGEHIAFLSDRDGCERAYVVRADGTELRRVGPAPQRGGGDDELAWSPDGRRLALTHRDGDGVSAIYVVDPVAGVPVRLSPEGRDQSQPAWSPDGRHLVVVEGGGLVVLRADGADSWPLDTGGLVAPALPRWLLRAPG